MHSSQYTSDVLYELVMIALIAIRHAKTGIDTQYGVTNTIQAQENAAARYADTSCTFLSMPPERNPGAVATNSNDAGAKKARN